MGIHQAIINARYKAGQFLSNALGIAFFDTGVTVSGLKLSELQLDLLRHKGSQEHPPLTAADAKVILTRQAALLEQYNEEKHFPLRDQDVVRFDKGYTLFANNQEHAVYLHRADLLLTNASSAQERENIYIATAHLALCARNRFEKSYGYMPYAADYRIVDAYGRQPVLPIQ